MDEASELFATAVTGPVSIPVTVNGPFFFRTTIWSLHSSNNHFPASGLSHLTVAFPAIDLLDILPFLAFTCLCLGLFLTKNQNSTAWQYTRSNDSRAMPSLFFTKDLNDAYHVPKAFVNFWEVNITQAVVVSCKHFIERGHLRNVNRQACYSFVYFSNDGQKNKLGCVVIRRNLY